MKQKMYIASSLLFLTIVVVISFTGCREEKLRDNDELETELAGYSAINIDPSIKEAIGVKDDEMVICGGCKAIIEANRNLINHN